MKTISDNFYLDDNNSQISCDIKFIEEFVNNMTSEDKLSSEDIIEEFTNSDEEFTDSEEEFTDSEEELLILKKNSLILKKNLLILKKNLLILKKNLLILKKNLLILNIQYSKNLQRMEI